MIFLKDLDTIPNMQENIPIASHLVTKNPIGFLLPEGF
jgi:hypothetical protein